MKRGGLKFNCPGGKKIQEEEKQGTMQLAFVFIGTSIHKHKTTGPCLSGSKSEGSSARKKCVLKSLGVVPLKPPFPIHFSVNHREAIDISTV